MQRTNIEAERGRLQMTKTAMCRELGITDKTVKMHITNMLQKTGYHSRLELAVKARHYGIAIKDDTV